MNKTERTFEAVMVNKIVSESNRKHGGMGNIDILAESIKTEGLINPPTIVANEDGTYRVVAGRRRVEAVRKLHWTIVEARVIDEADADRLEAIALAENVNRLEMSPLDEAETFQKLLDNGTAIEDIAAYYDRTVAGIRHRVRLCYLIDEIKELFRDGKIKLSAAALLASLPRKDQEKFIKKFGEKKSIGHWEVSTFMQSASKLSLNGIAGDKCEKCKNRTHNTTPGLFDDYYLHDICFDGECYANLWKTAIINLIAECDGEGNTGKNIILSQDIPKFLPSKTISVNLGGSEYVLLSHNSYRWENAKKKAKKDTAWFIHIDNGKVTADRVKYEKYERPTYDCYTSAPVDPVKEYLIDHIPDIRPEKRKAVAEMVKANINNSYRFREMVRERVLRAVINKRLREESRENMAAVYIAEKCSDPDENDETLDFTDEDDREIFSAIFGPEGITRIADIPKEPLIEKLFLFLTAASLGTHHLPELDDDDDDDRWHKTERLLFWKFAQMDREEYFRLYREIIAETVREAANLKPEAEASEEPADSESAGEYLEDTLEEREKDEEEKSNGRN